MPLRKYAVNLPVLLRAVAILALFSVYQGCFAGSDPGSLFIQAQSKYDRGDFKAALNSIKQAVKLAPENSNYQHLLGKCYGKLAESANWFSAIRLAKKTLRYLKKAVELDDRNVGALRDLREYYMQAPGFIGGSQDKAKAIDLRIAELESAN